MGILLQVSFRRDDYGTVLARRDDSGNYLAREPDEQGAVNYRIVQAPPIPEDALKRSRPESRGENSVQSSETVFIDLSLFHPLMHISRVMLYTYYIRNGLERVELLVSYPRSYGDKLENMMELYKGNISGMAQNWVAEDVLLGGSGELTGYSVQDIRIMSKGEKLTELRLICNSKSQAKRHRLERIVASNDFACTFFLNRAHREFFLAKSKEEDSDNKKGHQI